MKNSSNFPWRQTMAPAGTRLRHLPRETGQRVVRHIREKVDRPGIAGAETSRKSGILRRLPASSATVKLFSPMTGTHQLPISEPANGRAVISFDSSDS